MRKIETEASVAEVTSRQNLPQKAVCGTCFVSSTSSLRLQLNLQWLWIAMNTTRIS